MELVEKKKGDSKYKDFSREEVYSLHRLTATLSTVIIGFSFTILTLQDKRLYDNSFFQGPWDMFSFIGIVSFGSINVFSVWLWIKRSIYKYYNLFDNPPIKSMPLINRIQANAPTWEHWIWVTFLACFAFFLAFLIMRIFF